MDRPETQTTYECTIPFDPQRMRAAAVFCSDGRFGEQVDDLLHSALGLPRYDRLAVPGGAACLASHFPTYREEEAAVEQLRFLIATHRLERVVLVAHEDCGFYTGRLQVPPLQLESQQREDLRKAARRVQSLARHLRVDAFFARKQWERIVFELWWCTEPS